MVCDLYSFSYFVCKQKEIMNDMLFFVIITPLAIFTIYSLYKQFFKDNPKWN